MSARGARTVPAVVAVAAALLVACSGGGVVAELDALGETPWAPAGSLSFTEEDGAQLSPPLTVQGGGRGFALYVEVEGCAQVARLETGAFESEAAEHVWVSSLEGGVSCERCEERFSVIAGAGLIVHDPREPEDLDATLRFGRIDCATLTPLRSAEPASMRVWARALPVTREVEPLQLDFVHGPASPWAAPEDSARLAAGVSELLAVAGLEVVLARSSAQPALDRPLSWFEGTPEVLPPLAGGDRTVNVVFAGCLARVHPLLGSRVPLDGFVPRIPALGSPGAAVYLRHLGCSGSGGQAIRRSAGAQARLLAHELGHFLGLYHPQDAGGQRDRLPDTDGDQDTLMAAHSQAGSAPRVSPLQAARMRLHAALLAQGLPDRDAR